MKKRLLRTLAALLALCLMLGGCAKRPQEPADGTKYVSASVYPLYVLALNVTAGVPDLSLSCLVQPQDGCLRSYQLSEWDAANLAAQDAVILGGRGLESFADAVNSLAAGPIVLTCMSGMTLLSGDEADGESHLAGELPYPYLSTAGAGRIASTLAYSFIEIDPDYAALYERNLDRFLTRLDALTAEMADALSAAPAKKMAVMAEGALYFADQFALPVAAQIDHEPGVEPGDNELEDILTTLEGSGAQVVLLERQAPEHLVQALTEAGYAVALFDLMTTHMADGNAAAYEEIMRENCQRVVAALSGE